MKSKSINKLENSSEPIDRVNLTINDGNAWLRAANARFAKANRILGELSAERAKSKPPLPPIAPIPLLELMAPIEMPESGSDQGGATS
jgi:hypothetical protein